MRHTIEASRIGVPSAPPHGLSNQHTVRNKQRQLNLEVAEFDGNKDEPEENPA